MRVSCGSVFCTQYDCRTYIYAGVIFYLGDIYMHTFLNVCLWKHKQIGRKTFLCPCIWAYVTLRYSYVSEVWKPQIIVIYYNYNSHVSTTNETYLTTWIFINTRSTCAIYYVLRTHVNFTRIKIKPWLFDRIRSNSLGNYSSGYV